MVIDMTSSPPGLIPTAPGAIPFLGHVIPLLRDPWTFLARLPDHGEVVRLRLGPTPVVVVVCDPKLAHHVLLHDRIFDKGGPFIERVREAVGEGLATCPHRVHRRQRRMLQPAFHQARMPGYADIITAQISQQLTGWRDGHTVDIYSEMLALTSRMTVEVLFSGDLSADAREQLVEDVTLIISGIYRRMLMPNAIARWPVLGNRRYQRTITRLRHTVATAAANRRISGDQGDLLSAILSSGATDEENDREFTDRDITDQAVTFFIGGTETTAAVQTWALLMLAQHPDIAHRLYAEVNTVLAGRAATFSDLAHLPMTRHIVTETLRLWPPGWILTRVATTDTTIGDYPIPAGTPVVLSPYLIHHRGDLYPDPERFDPDRWSEDVDHARRDAFIPFGGGARQCIGDAFGRLEATLTLATITSSWRLALLPTAEPIRPARTATLHPRKSTMRTIARTHLQQPKPLKSGPPR